MNLNHQSFITEYLRHRSPFTAYCLAYNLKDCSNYESIMSSANRLMNNEEVGGTIRSILDNIRHEVEQEVRAELKQEVLTIQRKRELLASIATGEMVAVQLYKGKDCNVCTQMVKPTINQMLRAIDLDNKMVGLYPVYSRQSNSQQLTVEQSTKSEHASRNEREFTTTAQPSMRPKEIIMNEIKNELSPSTLVPQHSGRGVSALTGVGHSRETDHHEQPITPEADMLPNPSQDGNETGNHNISQQTEIKNTQIGNKTQQKISHAGLRKLLTSKPKTPLPQELLTK